MGVLNVLLPAHQNYQKLKLAIFIKLFFNLTWKVVTIITNILWLFSLEVYARMEEIEADKAPARLIVIMKYSPNKSKSKWPFRGILVSCSCVITTCTTLDLIEKSLLPTLAHLFKNIFTYCFFLHFCMWYVSLVISTYILRERMMAYIESKV